MKLPSSMQVFERGWLSSNNILFTGRDRTALIDSGYATHAEQTVALVRHALGKRGLDLLVNTHLHSDHCGGNAALQRAFSCSTAIPAAEAGKVREWNAETLTYKATGQQCERFGFSETIDPGDVLTLGDMAWQALAAPGHDPHSLIFFCADEGILISADALWENGFGVVFPELEGESGFAEVRATLELIASLDVKLVIPGHGAPFTDVGKALTTAFSRLDYFVADPARNAQNAIKVLLKFLLLDRQGIAMAEVETLMGDMLLVREANRRYLGKPAAELAQWAVAQLLRAGAAQVQGDRLLNRD
ncbi:MBL fold metallo-hydrolase [Noviherbaspirillum sp. CPCC 100848]|uniref:MBL fold metallo-hydrolase n=1 Tax=Noviherbaspirillum album TaxID=3080276 RepID=A0ABU6J6J9_9BURK|nr:MBL fold metallo-hydrolase [Noviherbaspirillum sp. CPCC 100848]MEC4718975.1 MBL fold metallo-hydrolase [Noviherbaspirillum sp. CPCC 100848]